ncbi:MAG TPA: hypothetical protein ENJ27_01035, partial [Candidatus Moranbacteria bacterium]|nr:hypothetical protein [Candidatus Moranbacteria bacterium]
MFGRIKSRGVVFIVGIIFIVAVLIIIVKNYESSQEEDYSNEVEIQSDELFTLEDDSDEIIVDTPTIVLENVESDSNNQIAKNEKSIDEKNDTKILPEKILLKVPFVAQAPFGIWDEYHEEACEEASLIMLKYFLDGKDEITKKEMEAEIQKMIKFQIDKYGDYKDSSMEDVVQLAQDFYGI